MEVPSFSGICFGGYLGVEVLSCEASIVKAFMSDNVGAHWFVVEVYSYVVACVVKVSP